MADPYVYTPEEVDVVFGVPVTIPGILDASFSINEFDEIAILHDVKFAVKKGIFNDPMLAVARSSSGTIRLSVLHGSEENEYFDGMYQMQTLGIAGLPLTIRYTAEGEDKIKRPNHFCPVTILTGRPQIAHKKEAELKVYTFNVPYLQTIYT